MICALLLSAMLLGDVSAVGRTPVGTVLEPGHLAGDEREISALVGRQLTRTVFAGNAVNLSDTKEADLVQRNGMVRMVGRKGPLRIETVGRALGAGPAGQQIRVMNMESRRVVSAVIVGPNLVEVPL